VGAALGILPHTGWSWLVRVSGSRGTPRVERRERISAGGPEGHLYHLAAERTRDRAGFLERGRAKALALAREALDPHLAGADAAVVLGKQVALPPLERILAAHPFLHLAEGELWRALFAEACAARGLRVSRSPAEEVRTAAATRHGSRAVAAFLAEGKRGLGSPWSREVQDAALAAWSAL
jgi:hypothetical protein